METFKDVTKHVRLQDEFMKITEERKYAQIQHRVKNDLLTIDSMIHFQSYYTDDEDPLELFKEIQNHVKSITQIHRKLYQSKDLLNIDFGSFHQKSDIRPV